MSKSRATRLEVPVAGAFFEARYPFVLGTYDGFDGENYVVMTGWQPGTRAQDVGPEDAEMVADAEGTVILSVVGTYKPGKFPTRVFFTRRWRDPVGKEFGKGCCRIATLEKFRRLSRGFYHPYRLLQASGGGGSP